MNLKCVICLKKLEVYDISATRCGHVFHTNCLEDCLDEHQSCPQCRRKPCTEKSIIPLYPSPHFDLNGGNWSSVIHISDFQYNFYDNLLKELESIKAANQHLEKENLKYKKDQNVEATEETARDRPKLLSLFVQIAVYTIFILHNVTTNGKMLVSITYQD
jgi:hypothetical protein